MAEVMWRRLGCSRWVEGRLRAIELEQTQRSVVHGAPRENGTARLEHIWNIGNAALAASCDSWLGLSLKELTFGNGDPECPQRGGDIVELLDAQAKPLMVQPISSCLRLHGAEFIRQKLWILLGKLL